MYYIGVDLGGTGIKVGIVDENGIILDKVKCPTAPERGHDAVIRDMAGLCVQVCEKTGIPMEEVHSIGIGIPGEIDPKTQVVPFLANLGWHDVPLPAKMREYIDKPVYVDNDATVAGVAEYWAGASKGTDSSVIVTLGTGVGGGVIINGKPWSGFHGVGSEIGHMTIVAGGELCGCGHRGCWERYASATAIIQAARRYCADHIDCSIMKAAGGDISKIEARTVIDLAREGDPAAAQLFDSYVYYLCVGLANLINTFDPEVLVLGGGVSHAGQFLLDAVNAKLPDLVFLKAMPYSKVVLAQLGNDAGIIGAALLGR